MSLLRAGLLALLLASTASAQQPVIDELQINDARVTSVPQGGVITAKGRGLHQCPPLLAREEGKPPPRNLCRHEELAVTIGSSHTLLLDCRSESVTFIVPQDVPVGPARLTVTLRGRGRASVELEVVEQVAERRGCGPPARPICIDEHLVPEQFRITRFDLLRDDRGARFEVAGLSGKVPDGFTLTVTLSVAQREIDQVRVPVAGGGFEAVFGPYAPELVLGNYATTALFEQSQQPRPRAREWRLGLSVEDAQAYERIERRDFLVVGTPDEVGAQRAAMQAHYRAHAAELSRLLDELEQAAAGIGAYRAWAESSFLPALTAAFAAHRAFRDATIRPIEPRAELHADHLVSIVLETFRQKTRDLYASANAEPPPSLLAVPGVDPVPAPATSRARFEAQRHLLLRAAGME